MLDEVEHLVRIADLVIVPADDLDEGVRQRDAGLGVEDGGAGVAEKVGRDDRLVGVAEDALELALARLAHRLADLIVGGGPFKVDRQVDHGNVQRGHAHRHPRELAAQGGDDLAHGLGSARGGGDDVARGRAAAAPVLHGRAVHGLLRGGDGVHGGHQAVLDAEAVVQDLGNGGKAVRRAGGVGDEGHLRPVAVQIDAADKHGRIVLRRGGHDDLFRACVDVGLRLFLREEKARGLDDILSAELAPRKVRGVARGKDGDLAPVHHEAAVRALHVGGKAAVHGVVFQHIGEIIRGTEVVDALDLDFRMVKAGAEDHAPDAAEAVDAYRNAHKTYFLSGIWNISNVWYV